jgi:hypothetical protein
LVGWLLADWRSDVPTCSNTTTSDSRSPARGRAEAPLEPSAETWLWAGRTVLRAWTNSVAPRRRLAVPNLPALPSRCVVLLVPAEMRAASRPAPKRTRLALRSGNPSKAATENPVPPVGRQGPVEAAAPAAAAARGELAAVVAVVRVAPAGPRDAPSKPATRSATRVSTTDVSMNVEPAPTTWPA